jgi:hypothetical protein
MSPGLQSLLVAVIVLACAWRALARFAPKTAWRWQAALSFEFERAHRPGWSRAVGRWLRPRAVAADGGCGSGCNTCGGCALPAPGSRNPLDLQLLS